MTHALSKLNFRDLGGLPARDGRRVREGALYRCEGPGSFDAGHRDELAALGIRLVCDLRSEGERAKAPNDWCDTGLLLNLDISNDLRAERNQGWEILKADPSEAGARRAILTNYASIPAAIRPHLPALVDAIAEGATPALVHCTAGKDRTGVLVALMLTLLGVPRTAVIDDYMRSEVFARNLRRRGGVAEAFQKAFGFVPSEATIEVMLGVEPGFLEAALGAVEQDWGSTEAYFESVGIDDARAGRFRAALLAEEA